MLRVDGGHHVRLSQRLLEATTLLVLGVATIVMVATAAQAANECGASSPGGLRTCSNPTYPGGITYTGLNSFTLNISNGVAVSSSVQPAVVNLQGTGAITLNASGATVTSSGGGPFPYSFSGNFFAAQMHGVLGVSTSGPVSLNISTVNGTTGGSAGVGGYSNSGAVSITAGTINMTGFSSNGINAEGASVSITDTTINTTRRGIVTWANAGNLTVNSGAINIVNNNSGNSSGIGIQATGGTSGNINITSGSITTSGNQFNVGMAVNANQGNTTITSGSITTNGPGAWGIGSFGSSAMDITSTGAITTNGGLRTVNDPTAGGRHAVGSALCSRNLGDQFDEQCLNQEPRYHHDHRRHGLRHLCRGWNPRKFAAGQERPYQQPADHDHKQQHPHVRNERPWHICPGGPIASDGHQWHVEDVRAELQRHRLGDQGWFHQSHQHPCRGGRRWQLCHLYQ